LERREKKVEMLYTLKCVQRAVAHGALKCIQQVRRIEDAMDELIRDLFDLLSEIAKTRREL
jgi:t-SNARE complex subunit (syntaxin)